MEKENLKELKKRLLTLLKKDALKKGKFVLSSGKIGNYYLDGRIITLSPEGAYLVASIILELIRDKNIDAIGGPTLGADPILGAISALSYLKKLSLKTFIIRKEPKSYGRKRQIEGPDLKKGEGIILIDDVVTTGESLLRSKKILKKMGVDVKEAICLVDRQEGGEENLKREDLKLISIFKAKDLL